MIAASIVIQIISRRIDGGVNIELTGFFSGILFGAGVTILFLQILKKRKRG